MSVYLCVLLLIGCHSLQNALCLGQMHPSPEISISKQTSLNSAVSILLDSRVQLLPSFFPFPGIHFLALASTISHSAPTLELSYMVLHVSLSGSQLS